MTHTDAKILNAILKISIAYNDANYESLRKLAENYECPEMHNFRIDEFLHYLDIISEYEIAKVVKFQGGFNVKPIPIQTERFVNDGGFFNILKEELDLQVDQKLEREKLKNETKLVKWQLRVFWYVFLIGFFGGIAGIISLIIQILK